MAASKESSSAMVVPGLNLIIRRLAAAISAGDKTGPEARPATRTQERAVVQVSSRGWSSTPGAHGTSVRCHGLGVLSGCGFEPEIDDGRASLSAATPCASIGSSRAIHALTETSSTPREKRQLTCGMYLMSEGFATVSLISSTGEKASCAGSC